MTDEKKGYRTRGSNLGLASLVSLLVGAGCSTTIALQGVPIYDSRAQAVPASSPAEVLAGATGSRAKNHFKKWGLAYALGIYAIGETAGLWDTVDGWGPDEDEGGSTVPGPGGYDPGQGTDGGTGDDSDQDDGNW